MGLAATRHVASLRTNGEEYAEQARRADMGDLAAALRKSGLKVKERAGVRRAYGQRRAKLEEAREVRGPWSRAGADAGPLAANVPPEFAEYLSGAEAWTRGETNAAIAAWENVLRLPASERRYKSTWAAFMLGKALLGRDPEKAGACLERVREFALAGYADSLGLAAASLGWQAKTHYEAGEFLRAAELYLEQAATGDDSAIVSLTWVAAKAVAKGPTELQKFAAHSKAQRLITAYLLSKHSGRPDSQAEGWLSAVEATSVTEVAAADQLALLAYQAGDVIRSKRWLKLAGASPVAQWLTAKLLLREGKVDAAAHLLTKVARQFPLPPAETNERAPPTFQESLYVDDGAGSAHRAAVHVWGELGAVRLARREYAQALDALLRAGFWDDAAFVAERVLTLDELKNFVQIRWQPQNLAPDIPAHADVDDASGAYFARLTEMGARLRHLLARRLTRSHRGSEAVSFLPPEHLAKHQAMLLSLACGDDPGAPASLRAQALMSAARIVRKHGLELLGTELEPDFAIFGGSFVGNISPQDRLPSNNPTSVSYLHASSDEQRRTAEPPADPPQRFHYRYQAAELAWDAAQLLPDHTEDKARFLCQGGSWLKLRDPVAADRFYKELVRKCHRTSIGALAENIRWFPLLDETGHLQPRQAGPPAVTGSRASEASSTASPSELGQPP
jgi:hypothetical protein